MKIHKEGFLIIPVSILILAGLWFGFYFLSPLLAYILAIPGIIFAGLIINFFRNPDIQIGTDPNHILSPCNGKVVVIEEIEENQFFKEKVWQISIFMSPLDVHVNRNPISGQILQLKYFPGKYLMAFNPKSSTLNEQNLIITSNDKITIGYKQIAGFLARRIKWYVQELDHVTQGEEYGFIRFGSRLDVLVPTSVSIEVKLDDKVKAGQSILASIPKT